MPEISFDKRFGELEKPVEETKCETALDTQDEKVGEKIKEALTPQEAQWLTQIYRRFFEFEKEF